MRFKILSKQPARVRYHSHPLATLSLLSFAAMKAAVVEAKRHDNIAREAVNRAQEVQEKYEAQLKVSLFSNTRA